MKKNLLNKIAFVLFMFILIVAPLAFAAVHTWAYTLSFVCILVGILFVAAGFLLQKPHDRDLIAVKTPIHIFFGLLFLYLLFQMVPLPMGLVKQISTGAAVCAQRSVPPVQVVGGYNEPGWATLAPYIYPVRMSLVRLICYWLLTFGLLQVIDSRKKMSTVIFILLGIALFEALYGFIQAYGGTYKIWWYKRNAHVVTGTFINPNHFAGYMMILVFLSFGYAVGSWMTAYEKISRRRLKNWRERVLSLSASKGELARVYLIFFFCVIMLLALVFSRSRGGIVCFVIALCLFGTLYLLKQGRRYISGMLFAFVVLTAAYSIYIGLDPVLERFREGIDQDSRLRNAPRVMQMIGDYTATGAGVGNFRHAFLRYEAGGTGGKLIVFAHDDWAQWTAETGMVGLVILLTTLLWYLYDIFKKWLRQSDPMAVSLGLGMIASFSGIALHSFVDFDLHIPAVPITLAAVAAVGYAAIHLEGRDTFHDAAYRSRFGPVMFYGISLFIIGIALWAMWISVRHYVAEVHCTTVLNDTLHLVKNPTTESIKEAISWDGANAGYRYTMARELMRQREEWKKTYAMGEEESRYSEDKVKEDRRRILQIVAALETAAGLNPFNAEYHHRLGWHYTYLWREPDYHSKWLLAADIAMERAAYFAGETNSKMHVDLGHYWVMRSRSMDPSHPMWDSVWARACWHYMKARQLDGAKAVVDEITKYVQNFYPNDPEKLKEALGM